MASANNTRVRRPTRNDVARSANVSGWTVSNVLNGHDDVSISEQTRRRVLEAAALLGYQPNNSARALATGRTRTIGVWMCLGYSRYRAHALHRMQQLIRRANFELVIRDIEEELNHDPNPANAFRIPVDAVIAFDTPTAGKIVMQSAFAPAIPFVSMGAYWTNEHDYVGVDLYSGAVDAMHHLVETGRKRIAYLLPKRPEDNDDYRECRAIAYSDVMKESGLQTEYLFTADLSLADSREAVSRYVREHPEIDAILCHDDGMAFGAHRALSDLGLRIGEDIALVGCDGIDETEYLSPPLTTIVQPIGQMCDLAWRYLETRIKNPTKDLQQCILKPTLTIRASSIGGGAASSANINSVG
jgi:LacI family transcriptional regulator